MDRRNFLYGLALSAVNLTSSLKSLPRGTVSEIAMGIPCGCGYGNPYNANYCAGCGRDLYGSTSRDTPRAIDEFISPGDYVALRLGTGENFYIESIATLEQIEVTKIVEPMLRTVEIGNPKVLTAWRKGYAIDLKFVTDCHRLTACAFYPG